MRTSKNFVLLVTPTVFQSLGQRDEIDWLLRVRKDINLQIITNVLHRDLEDLGFPVSGRSGVIYQRFIDDRDFASAVDSCVASLGLETFRVPQVRKAVIPNPSVTTTAGKPETTLGEDYYRAILQVIHDTGKTFERLPDTYAGKGEETLRDHLILVLEPNFQGSTTGETFNKSGKTDILIRHEKSNIFVAECKYWEGKKKHLETIDQLLSYLTWRDSKTAVICFVGRKDFSNILKEIELATKEYPCFVRYLGAKEATWLDFEFHLPDDPDRRVKMAVLAFHLPQQ